LKEAENALMTSGQCYNLKNTRGVKKGAPHYVTGSKKSKQGWPKNPKTKAKKKTREVGILLTELVWGVGEMGMGGVRVTRKRSPQK